MKQLEKADFYIIKKIVVCPVISSIVKKKNSEKNDSAFKSCNNLPNCQLCKIPSLLFVLLLTGNNKQ